MRRFHLLMAGVVALAAPQMAICQEEDDIVWGEEPLIVFEPTESESEFSFEPVDRPKIITEPDQLMNILHQNSSSEWTLERWVSFMSEDGCEAGESLVLQADGTATREFCKFRAVDTESGTWKHLETLGSDFVMEILGERYLLRVRDTGSYYEMRMQTEAELKNDITKSLIYRRAN